MVAIDTPINKTTTSDGYIAGAAISAGSFVGRANISYSILLFLFDIVSYWFGIKDSIFKSANFKDLTLAERTDM